MTNYYLVLGIGEDASDSEIKAAFKQKALVYHPDKNPDDPDSEEMFKLINAANQTLSNPYERARFDLKLKFGEAVVDSPPPPAAKYSYTRPNYGRPIDHKTNDRATFWAFSLSLGVAIVVMTGMELFNMYNAHERDIMLGQRRQVFEQAKDHQATGEISASLLRLESLGTFHKEEEDMLVFQEDILDDLLQGGTRNFYRNNFEAALQDFQIFDDFAINKRLSFEVLFAETHMMAGNYDEAIGRFNKIIVSGNNTIENNLKVAWIYREGKKDYEQAMNYYEKVSKMATSGYKRIYGEAYPLILSPRIVPPTHFDIFDGMAQTFFYLGNYERALSAIKWNLIMWPDYPENYLLKGKVFQAQGKAILGCTQFDLAIEKGWDESIRCGL